MDGPDADSLESYDAVVVAAGVESEALVRHLGVKLPLVAGRGYSFGIKNPDTPQIPVYVPERRLACTPTAEGYRVVGVMEFGVHGRPGQDSRIHDCATRSARSWPSGETPSSPTHWWVGSRPCTTDGLAATGLCAGLRLRLGASQPAGDHDKHAQPEQPGAALR